MSVTDLSLFLMKKFLIDSQSGKVINYRLNELAFNGCTNGDLFNAVLGFINQGILDRDKRYFFSYRSENKSSTPLKLHPIVHNIDKETEIHFLTKKGICALKTDERPSRNLELNIYLKKPEKLSEIINHELDDFISDNWVLENDDNSQGYESQREQLRKYVLHLN